VERYAHSYIGIGLTSKAGKELNKNKLNRFNELVIVLRVLFFMRPTRISVQGKVHSYDSVIFSNINKMSKVLKLSEDASPSDGKFEVMAFRRRSKFKLIRALIKSSILGLKGDQQVTNYEFRTLKRTSIQLDGEITMIDANSDVKIGIEPKALACIV
jgi:diacylglycerol kinase family enzyme